VMVPKPPFKGRPGSELVKFATECTDETFGESMQVDNLSALTLFLLDMDSDCHPSVKLENLEDDPNGLQPAAMVRKMDMVLEVVLRRFERGVPDSVYNGLLDIFESSVLKLYQPHYIQFVTFYLAASTKERADSFLSLLLNIIHDEDTDPIARREAISFLGSFVVRANTLSWTHSARVSRYLVSFMNSLKEASSTQDKTLLVLCIQTVMYILCWECDRWKENLSSSELDWISRCGKSLTAVLARHRVNGVLRLVDMEILRTVYSVSGRLSTQLKQLVYEGISTYKQLLTPSWKVVNELNLLKPHFPFDPFTNLPKTCPIILPLCREWTDPIRDVPDNEDSTVHAPVAEESSAQEDEERMEEDETAIWDFRPLKRAITGEDQCEQDHMVMASPTLGPIEYPSSFDDNLVLTRILSSQKFASAPSSR